MGADLLSELRLAGLQIVLDGDRVVVTGWLTDELRTRIREGKADLVAALRPADDRVRCISCRHLKGWRCTNHQAVLLQTDAVGGDLASLPQRCSGFAPRVTQ